MKILILVFLTHFSLASEPVANPKAKAESKEPSTAEKVDKSLTEGARTFKKKFMDAEEEPKKDAGTKTKADKSEKSAKKNDLEDVADGLNKAWYGAIHGVGKVLKTQDTEEKPKQTEEKK